MKTNRSFSTEIQLIITEYFVDEKRNAYGKEFLNDIATQNYSKYGIDTNNGTTRRSWSNQLINYNQKGKMYVVNHRNINDMFATAAAACTDIWFEKQFIKSQIIVHQPFYDQSVKGKIRCLNISKVYSTNSNQNYYVFAHRSSDLHNKNLPGLWNRRYFNFFVGFSRRFDLPFQSVFEW